MMPENPSVPPTSRQESSANADGDANSLVEIVLAQRGMMWLFIAKLGVDFTVNMAQEFGAGPIPIAYLSIFVLVALAMGYFVFRLSNATYGIGPAVVCTALSFVPCLGLFTILILNGSTMDRLRKSGVKVGFMGATKTQLAEIRS